MLVQPRLALWADMHQICSELTPTMELNYIAHFAEWNMLCGLDSTQRPVKRVIFSVILRVPRM